MFNLVIFCVYEPLSGLQPKEFVLPTDFDTQSQAELRALRWLTYRPHDIVMFLEVT